MLFRSKKVDNVVKDFQRIRKPLFARKRIITDASKITVGAFIELQHWLKKDPIEVMHLVVASLLKKRGNHKKDAEKILNKRIGIYLNDVMLFIDSLNKLFENYKHLFELDLENEIEEKPHPFIVNYGWLFSATQVAAHLGININECYKINVIEFFNSLAYLKSKQDYERKKMK